ncbi:MAG: M48 family metalloprotease [Myxococcota bacterium]
MFTRRRLLGFGLALVCLAVGCALNPVTRRPELILVSKEQEQEMGRQAAVQVAAEMGIVEERKVAGYVEAVGKRLAPHSPREDVVYTFQVVDIREPNAFALPDGHVYVSRGLLAIANSEDELACAIGHEMAHVAARHAAQRQTRAVGVGLLALPGALVGAAVGRPVGQLLGAPVLLLGGGMLAAYSRDQEREADRVGQEMAAEAGFDPRGLADFLDGLEVAIRATGEKSRRPTFFDTHPRVPERAAKAREHAGSLEWEHRAGIAGGHAGFLERIEGLLVGQNPAEGVFQGQRFLHPDLDFAMTFPDGWKAVNARDGVGALSEQRDAQIALEIQGRGSDPARAGQVFLDELSRQITLEVVQAAPLSIGELPAFRADAVATARRGPVPLEFTWIAHRGTIFRVSAASASAPFPAYQPVFRKVAGSFRPLRDEERSSIHEKRLRVVPARGGETLAELAERTGNSWELKQLAAANGLSERSRLESGQLVKIAVSRVYRARRGGPGSVALAAVDRIEEGLAPL